MYDKSYCLVLSGGGAKGVYHIGAWRALKELGVRVDAFVGNSIGAVIAGFLAQGLEAELEAIGAGIGIDYILNLPGELVEDGELKLGMEVLPRLRELARDLLARRGLDTSPLRALLEQHLDENKIRACGKDLGIVTVNLSDLRPREVFLEAMEPGALLDYLMASAAFPGFAPPVIRGKKYVDGGLFDNIPYAMARKRGYRRIIVVDVSGAGINRRPEIDGSETIYIKNSIAMGGVLDFDRGFLDRFTRLGYLDTLRVFGRLAGYSYFVRPDETAERACCERLAAHGGEPARQLLAADGAIFPERMRYDRRILLKSLECAATILEVERVAAYTYAELGAAIAGRRAAEDVRIEALAGPPGSAGRGRLYEGAVDAIRKARLDRCPYFYLRLVRALARGRTLTLLEKTLGAFVPELVAGMAWLELGEK